MFQPKSSLLDRNEGAVDVDVSIVKLWSFIGLTAFSAGLSGYFIGAVNLRYMIISAAVFLVLFTLQTFFIKGWRRIVTAVIIESSAFFLPVLIMSRGNISTALFLAFGLLVYFLSIAESSGRKVITNSMVIPFWSASKIVLYKVIPGVIIFASVVYFATGSLAVGENGSAIKSFIAPAVRLLVPDFSPEMSTRQLLENVIKRSLSKEQLAAFDDLPQSAKDDAIRNFERNIEGYTGPIDIDASFIETVYGFFTKKVGGIQFGELSAAYKVYLLSAVITLAWFVVKIMTLIIFAPVAVLTFVLYETLIVTNFITIQYEPRSREIILLK